MLHHHSRQRISWAAAARYAAIVAAFLAGDASFHVHAQPLERKIRSVPSISCTSAVILEGYTLEVLEYNAARGLSDTSHVVGSGAPPGFSRTQPVMTYLGNTVALPTFQSGSSDLSQGSGYAVSKSGQYFAGDSLSTTGYLRAFVYDQISDTLTEFGAWGANYSRAFAVNSQGVAVGESHNNAGTGSYAMVFRANDNPSTWTRIVNVKSRAVDINDAGMVIGNYKPNSALNRAFYYDTSSPQPQLIDLTDRLVSYGFNCSAQEATAINDAGMMVFKGSCNGAGVLFRYDLMNPTQAPINIPVLPNTYSSSARGKDIADNGTVVGSCLISGGIGDNAFIWDPINGTRNLQSLLVGPLPPEGVTLHGANSINELGQIVSGGMLGGTVKSFLLTPKYRNILTCGDPVSPLSTQP